MLLAWLFFQSIYLTVTLHGCDCILRARALIVASCHTVSTAGVLEKGCDILCYWQIEGINKDDYFVKNAEFTTWLREHKSKFFNEMDSDETRALFGKGVHNLTIT